MEKLQIKKQQRLLYLAFENKENPLHSLLAEKKQHKYLIIFMQNIDKY